MERRPFVVVKVTGVPTATGIPPVFITVASIPEELLPSDGIHGGIAVNLIEPVASNETVTYCVTPFEVQEIIAIPEVFSDIKDTTILEQGGT